MRMIAMVFVLGALQVPLAAFADVGGIQNESAVARRLYQLEGRTEVGVGFGFPIVSRFVDQFQLQLTVSRSLVEWLAVEARGGYSFGVATSLANDLRSKVESNSSIRTVSDFADFWHMAAHGVLGFRFQPLYGKISLLGELPVHFQVYAWLGGGAAQLRRESPVLCVDGNNPCQSYWKQERVSPLLSAALGIRFFLGSPNHLVRFELRDSSYLDSYYLDVDRQQVRSDGPTAGGRLAPSPPITAVVSGDVGYSFVF